MTKHRSTKSVHLLPIDAEQYRQLFDFSPDPSWVFDEKTLQFLAVNQAACRHYGYSRRKFLAMTMKDIRPDVPLLLRQIRQVRGKVGASLGPVQHRRKDGSLITVEINTNSVMFAGRLARLSVMRDITEKKHIEAELRTAVEQYRTLADNSPIIIDRFDREFRHLYMNVAGQRLHTRRASRLVGKTIAETGLPEPFCSLWEKRIEQVFKTGKPLDVEDAFPTPKGIGYFNSRCVPEFDDRGNVATVLVVSSDVTQRRQAEEALRQSEANLVEAQRIAKMGSWTFEVSTGAVWWSDELFRIFEVKKNRFGGWYESFLKRVHPDDRSKVVQTNVLARTTGKSFELEYRIRTRQKTIKTIYEIGYAKKDSDGKVIGLFGMAQDITERKGIEEALRLLNETLEQRVSERTKELQQSEAHLTEAEALAHLGHFEIKSPPEPVVWSAGMYRLTGRDPSLGLPTVADFAETYVHPEDRQEVGVRMSRLFSEGGKAEAEYRLVRSDGTQRIVRSIGRAQKDATGRVVRIFGTLLDITESKKVEAALQESEQRNRNLLEWAPIGISVIVNDKVRYVNPECVRLLGGHTAADLLGRPALYFTHPDDIPKINARLQAVLVNRTAVELEERRLVCLDGQVRFVLASTVPIIYEGEPGALSVMRDVTELRRLEHALTEITHREQTRLGHDLHDNTCQQLVGISLMSATLADQLREMGMASIAAIANTIVAEARQTLMQVRDISHSLSPLGLEEGDLHSALNQLAQIMTQTLDVECSLSVKGTMELPKGEFLLHLYRIAQEAMNNAIRHGEAKNIQVGLEQANGWLTLTVQDDGVGFSEKAMKGTPSGMGLSIMRYRASSIGGTLSVQPTTEHCETIITCSAPLPKTTGTT